MRLVLSEQMVNEFLSGLLVVLILISVGSLLALSLNWMTKRFPFSRIGLVLGITPYCLIKFIDRGDVSALYFFSMIIILIGLTIDGIAHLLVPKKEIVIKTIEKLDQALEAAEDQTEQPNEAKPGMIVWEKAE